MVLVVVTKGQQEALIPLAPVQKQCTGSFKTRALLMSLLLIPDGHHGATSMCQVIQAYHLCIWSIML